MEDTNVNCVFIDGFINRNCCNVYIHTTEAYFIVCFICSEIFKEVTKQVLA